MENTVLLREAQEADLSGLLALYAQLGDNPIPQNSENLLSLWREILAYPGHHIVIAEVEGQLAASCVLQIIPNLTHGQRPYALVENVVTDAAFRRQGLASSCLNWAREKARTAGCYKLMLLTGSKGEGTLHFYEKAGYNRKDKTAFIQWLE